jgi:hypothetical protein
LNLVEEVTIDLSGLFVADVQVRVQGNGAMVITSKEDCVQDVLALPKPIWVRLIKEGTVEIDPHGYDIIALAERLASTWESRGYTVERVAQGQCYAVFCLLPHCLPSSP